MLYNHCEIGFTNDCQIGSLFDVDLISFNCEGTRWPFEPGLASLLLER